MAKLLIWPFRRESLRSRARSASPWKPTTAPIFTSRSRSAMPRRDFESGVPLMIDLMKLRPS